MIDTPIEQRYNKTNRMFHSSGFAIAAGVVAVGAAAGSAAISMSASDKAAKAQAGAGKKYNKQLAQATGTFNKQQQKLKKQLQKMNVEIDIPQYNLQNATIEGIEAANRVTANTLQQLETVAPGSAQARQQVGTIINSYLRGEVPQDVQEQITRMTAERAGAGFRPPQGGGMGPSGFQAAQGQLARNLGLTSLDLQQGGVNMASSWQQAATSFIQSPTQMMALGLQGRGQDIDVAQANIRNRMSQLEMIGGINMGQYNAATGQAQQGYGVAQQGIEATLASRQAIAQGVQSIGSATSGALSGMGSAYGQLATAQGASTTPTSSGFYQGQLGAAKAYNVAPSQLSYQQGGGYYYTPSGAYGR
jgi:hypothetical protein